MPVTFNFQKKTTIRDIKKIKNFIPFLLKKERKNLTEITIVLCSDAYLLNLNRKFLQHDFYTDIITFDLSLSDSSNIEGELFISIDRVKDNARNFKVKVQQELKRVIIHGVLHLCGYSDKEQKEKSKMKKKEEFYLSQFIDFQ
ncbi:MAG: rRNA maturation RNase YbeY [Ferruginibacter sp.]